MLLQRRLVIFFHHKFVGFIACVEKGGGAIDCGTRRSVTSTWMPSSAFSRIEMSGSSPLIFRSRSLTRKDTSGCSRLCCAIDPSSWISMIRHKLSPLFANLRPYFPRFVRQAVICRLPGTSQSLAKDLFGFWRALTSGMALPLEPLLELTGGCPLAGFSVIAGLATLAPLAPEPPRSGTS